MAAYSIREFSGSWAGGSEILSRRRRPANGFVGKGLPTYD
jgi:hypothetical protein